MMPLGLSGAIRNPGRALLLFAAFSVAATLVMAGSIFSSSTKAAFDSTYERQNGADMSLWVGGSSCASAQAQAAHLPPSYSAEVRCAIPGGTRLALKSSSIRISLQVMEESPKFWQLIPRSGSTEIRALAVPGEPAVILEDRLASEAGIRIGDMARVDLGNRALEARVIGTVSDPSKGPYPLFRPATLYASPATAAALGVAPRPERLLVKSTTPIGAGNKQRVIDDVEASGFVVYEGLTTPEYREFRASLSTVIERFVAGVAMLATIGAALLVAMLQQASVVEESREIAILKAIGHTPVNIAAQMLIRSLAVALAGVIFGALVGLATHKAIATWAAELVDGISEPRFDIAWVTGMATTVLMIAALFSIYPSLAAARIRTAAALRKAPVLRTRRLTPPAPIMSRPVASIGAGFLTRRPARAIMAILAVAATLSVILGATGAKSFSENLSSNFSGDNFDLTASGSGISYEGIQELMRSVPSVAAAAPRYGVPQVRDQAGKSYWFEAFEISQDLHRPAIFEGRPIARTGEILLGPGALQRIGARLGDTVHLEIGGVPASVEIVGVIRGLRGMGDVGEISVETLLGLGIAPRLNSFMVRVDPESDPDSVAHSIFTLSNGNVEARGSGVDTNAITRPLTLAMTASSIVVMATGILALVLIMLLTLREFAKEMTIVKTIGGSTTTLLAGFALYGGLLGLLAGLAAIPLSRVLTGLVFGSILKSLGVTGAEMVGQAPQNLIITITVLTGCAIGAVMSLRLALKRPASALRED
ncbi:MAG: hypothetical protein DCC49_05590 [Acidobacteria bacterium]|nr:MAG: hypothetical protein DCC49_05590 [Acidobacteriota bacterium]